MRIKTILITLVIAFAAGSTWANEQAKDKTAAEASFKQFLSESAKRREAQAKEMYDLKSDLLEAEYKEQQNAIAEINELSQKMKFGDREHNKKLRKQIKEKWKSLKSNRHDGKEKVEELRKKFKQINREHRKKLKNLLGETYD